ncbi:uncharacterized protein LOC131849476 [Achroia grisella]|uniref:uncharacterized protein LOC131849476 n=1 Tax=Achroia grisella TaxID=688607 RepID=UPI0027D3226F|nr:uncharacterized protein LOC131849476 [Achroia grisella]
MDALSFMDLLDLDEEVINNRLKSIMVRESYTNKHLANALELLRYKYLINTQENSECENNEEYTFAVKLINQMNSDNFDGICKIVSVTLSLSNCTLANKSEHLLQQIISSIDFSPEKLNEDNSTSNILLNFQLCDSILDTVISNDAKLYLPCLELPINNILFCHNEKLKVSFLINTVPRLFQGVSTFRVLDIIWFYLKDCKGDQIEMALKVLSCLSEYYLPVLNDKGELAFESELVTQVEFWNIVISGLMSLDATVRKISIYLCKRAVDCLTALNKNVVIMTGINTILQWYRKNEIDMRNMWENYFTLIDSLEEKQSNIVLPSLTLFHTLSKMGHVWLNCAFNIGLRHDNLEVRVKCIHYRLETVIYKQPEVIVLLEALNDINIYENPAEYQIIMKKLTTLCHDIKFFLFIYKSLPLVNWSPVPLFHVSSIVTEIWPTEILKLSEKLHLEMRKDEVAQLLKNLLKIPCNIVALRKAIHINIANLFKLCCLYLHSKDFLSILSSLEINVYENSFLVDIMQYVISRADEKDLFLESIMETLNIDFILFYLECEGDELFIFDDLLQLKIRRVQEVVNRQYCNKKECLVDVVFITQLYSKTVNNKLMQTRIERDFKFIVYYINSILSSSDITLTIDEMTPLFNDSLSIIKSSADIKETLLQLYSTSNVLINDKETVLDKAVLSMYVINSLHKNSTFICEYKHEMLDLDRVLKLVMNFDNKQSVGRLTNALYEYSCELVHSIIKNDIDTVDEHMNNIIAYVENVIECGGYGCLIWILRIMNLILPTILNKAETFDLTLFMSRMWKEIEELKSNNQYSPCIEEFINLIMQDTILQTPLYNNTVILYCNKIIEFGPTKNIPLSFLITKLNTIEITSNYGQLVYILTEILLYTPVPRKDQRILENLLIELLEDSKYECCQLDDTTSNLQIQYLAVLALSKIIQPDILSSIISLITKKIDDVFKNKQRYHAGSQSHRTVLIALQHLLCLLLKSEVLGTESLRNWCAEFLGKLPHQMNVRLCLEWIIALCCYIQETKLNKELLQELSSKKVPITSQLVILFWVLKRKLTKETCKNDEYNFVIETLLSHTMGQMFNVRLHAQYMATELHKLNECNSEKYAYTIEIIDKTFKDNNNDKNFVKMKHDYLFNTFDIVADLTPAFIYYFLTKYAETAHVKVDIDFVGSVLGIINENFDKTCSNFQTEWKACRKPDEEVFRYKFGYTSASKFEDTEVAGTIQKKYIPWKNMGDVSTNAVNKKRESPSDMIVVATLIDKLPNLGGMARTSEVFGVKTYVVDSLRHLHDKQFQSLSVSAERWIDVEEVRPGLALKQYLMKKKGEGYAVIAAEQTSNSRRLDTFKFPQKTLLLLGHEKEGVPCDLLPLMDYCVEIPQQGMIRSLNVHVTAAIFVWEYARQNIL